MARRVRTAATGLLLGVLAALAVPSGPAAAHAAFLTSDPPAGTVLDAAPGEVVLTFSEPVRAVTDRIRVIAPDGTRADRGAAVVRGAKLHIPLRAAAARGSYVVSYRVISADSHPVSGGLVFSVGSPSANAAEPGDPEPTTSLLMRTGVAVARFAGYAGLIGLTGPVLFLLLLWPRRLPTTGPARLAFVGAGVLAAATLIELCLQVPYSSGGGFSVEAAQQVLNSPYGTGHLIRLAVLAALFLILRPVVRGQERRADRVMLGLLAVIGAITWPIAGHPSASRAPWISVLADAVHLAAVAVWLGGLVVLVGFLLRRASVRELRAILPVWSRWALVAVGTILVTGTVSALIEIESVRSLRETLYGQLVLAKIGLFAVIVGLAAWVRRGVNRSYVGSDDESDPTGSATGSAAQTTETAATDPIARTRLRRGVLTELGVAVVVVAVAAVLVQSVPSNPATAGTSQGPYSVTVTSKLYQLQVEVDPLATGANTVHLYAYAPNGAPIKVLEWRASAALPEQDLEPVSIPLVVITDNHASGQATLPTAGTWELRFTLRTTDVDQATVIQRVTVP
ncbi:MAG TPA: copper resistance protein CopC [Micromonosporaceae bacterium]|nr:copper resistance protein CopC [Micromonosporaceae bacterium]